ncbi:hypothetical protein [Geopseudomonas aromaticivorans]
MFWAIYEKVVIPACAGMTMRGPSTTKPPASRPGAFHIMEQLLPDQQQINSLLKFAQPGATTVFLASVHAPAGRPLKPLNSAAPVRSWLRDRLISGGNQVLVRPLLLLRQGTPQSVRLHIRQHRKLRALR